MSFFICILILFIGGIDIYDMVCFCILQVLVLVFMCLLDWFMVILVLKLLFKINEDENVILFVRVFQV